MDSSHNREPRNHPDQSLSPPGFNSLGIADTSIAKSSTFGLSHLSPRTRSELGRREIFDWLQSLALGRSAKDAGQHDQVDRCLGFSSLFSGMSHINEGSF